MVVSPRFVFTQNLALKFAVVMKVRSIHLSYLYVAVLALMTLMASYLALVSYVKAIDGSFFDILDKFYWALILGLVIDSMLICGIGKLASRNALLANVFVGDSYKLFYHIGASVLCVALLYLLMIVIY